MGLFSCIDSFPDCLLGFCVPCVEAGIAANNAGHGKLWTVLQCLFFPLLAPIMRYQVREDEDIEVV